MTARGGPARHWKTALGMIGAAVLLYALALSGRPSREDLPLPPARDFAFPDLAGKTVSLSAYKGQVVLVDFWATWCDPCIEELPELKALHERYKGRGFTLLAISMDALGAKAVSSFVKEHAVPYPVLLSGGEAPEGWPMHGIPTAFLVNRDGLIVRRYLGPKLLADLSRDVEEQL